MMQKSDAPDFLKELETRYKWKVLRLAERYGAGNDAEDVWQGVCLRIKELRVDKALGSFIHMTASHLCLDIKRKAHRQDISLEDMPAEPLHPHQKNPEEQLLAQEQLQLVEQALKALLPAEREIVELIDFHGLKPQEVSVILNKPPNTIHVFYYRAKKKMRAFIEATGWRKD
ncbi:MAG: RNA polymerase sigma factor [Acidobacteria bacterium]|nr:RNA polymerase sigma factor [Acidobacteriota bacterium]